MYDKLQDYCPFGWQDNIYTYGSYTNKIQKYHILVTRYFNKVLIKHKETIKFGRRVGRKTIFTLIMSIASVSVFSITHYSA